jgi:O-antigen ligase
MQALVKMAIDPAKKNKISSIIRRFILFGDRGISLLVWTLGSYVALVPSLSILPTVTLFNEKRVLQVGLLVLVGGLLLVSYSSRRQWLSTFRKLPSLARWCLRLILSIGIVSSVLAPAPFYAFLEVGHNVLLFVLAGAVASVVRRDKESAERVFIGVICAGTLLYVVYFGVGYSMHLVNPGVPVWPEGSTNFANIRIFNHYQTWTLSLLAGGVLWLPRRHRIMNVGLFGVTALWWALMFASDVRGTVVAHAVAAVGVGLLFRGRAKKWLFVVGASLLVGIALYYLMFSGGSIPPVVERFGDASQYPWRIQRWITSLEMARAHPWAGAGPMHFAWPPFRFASGASPHNTLMQWLAEWGIPGTLLMSGLTVWGGWSWIRQEREDADRETAAFDGVRVALIATMLAGATHSMVSGLTLAPLSQMLLVFVGGWAWGRYQHDGGDFSYSITRLAHAALCVVLLGSTLVVGSSLKDLYRAQERREAFLESVERDVLSPRYWTQGYIGVRDSSVIEQARRDR